MRESERKWEKLKQNERKLEKTRLKRIDLYNNAIKFIKTRVDLDLAEFSEDIWAH